jgi:hypothetical protein
MPAQPKILLYAPRQRAVRPWFYVMANLEQQLLLIDAIDASPEPMATMKVWLAATARIEPGTNRVAATVGRIASDAKVSVPQASRALARLHRIGALQRLGRGSYRVNPHVAFRGSLEEREAALCNVVPLKPGSGPCGA